MLRRRGMTRRCRRGRSGRATGGNHSFVWDGCQADLHSTEELGTGFCFLFYCSVETKDVDLVGQRAGHSVDWTSVALVGRREELSTCTPRTLRRGHKGLRLHFPPQPVSVFTARRRSVKHHHEREEGKQQHGSEVEERQSGEGVSRVFQFWIISRGTAIKKKIT